MIVNESIKKFSHVFSAVQHHLHKYNSKSWKKNFDL